MTLTFLQIIQGRHSATMYLCTPDLIRAITPRLGRVLGPLGLMPSERRGTVTDDIAGFIRRLQGTSEWKGDKVGAIRTPIAKVSAGIEGSTSHSMLVTAELACGRCCQKHSLLLGRCQTGNRQ